MTTSWTPPSESPPARAGVEFSSSSGIGDQPRAPRPERQRWLVIGLTVAIVAAAVGAVLVRSGTSDRAEAIAFRYGFQPGETRTYDFRMGMDMRFGGIPETEVPRIKGTMTATMAMRVEEVREDGSALVAVSMGGLGFEVDGMDEPPVDFPQSMQMRVTLSPTGEVLEAEGSIDAFDFALGGSSPLMGANPSGQSNSQLFFPAFPEEAIAPGDTWTQNQEVPLGFGDEVMTFTIEGRHAGFEDTNYGRAAKIEQAMSVPMDFEFAFGQLIAGFADAFGSSGAEQVPPGLEDAKMIFSGEVSGSTTSLVIPQNADAVSVDGTMDMNMSIKLENFPSMPGEQVPDEMTIDGTFDIRMRRID